MAREPDRAQTAYDALATDYDAFTSTLDYEPWLEEVLPRLAGWGLSGNRLLDVGCGTGKSLIPMLERGWRCWGCDISPAMIEIARGKLGDRAELFVADMRELGEVGSFDLVWSLNDSLNYLADAGQLAQALRAMRANMADAGLLVFDVNMLRIYRTFFAERLEVEHGGRRLLWEGRTPTDLEPGGVATAHLEAEGDPGSAHVHSQHHFPEPEIRDAIERAGLECLAAFGQDNEAKLHEPPSELDHVKALYVARRRL